MQDPRQGGQSPLMLPRRALAGLLRFLPVAVGLMLVMAGHTSQAKPLGALPVPHSPGRHLNSSAQPLNAFAGIIPRGPQFTVPPSMSAPPTKGPISTPAPSGSRLGVTTEDGVNLR